MVLIAVCALPLDSGVGRATAPANGSNVLLWGDGYDIWKCELPDCSSHVNLTSDITDRAREPEVSPDGTTIVFMRQRDWSTTCSGKSGSRQQLWTMDVDGGNKELLIASRNEDFNGGCTMSLDLHHPRFTPDGASIYFLTRYSSPSAMTTITRISYPRTGAYASGYLNAGMALCQPREAGGTWVYPEWQYWKSNFDIHPSGDWLVFEGKRQTTRYNGDNTGYGAVYALDLSPDPLSPYAQVYFNNSGGQAECGTSLETVTSHSDSSRELGPVFYPSSSRVVLAFNTISSSLIPGTSDTFTGGIHIVERTSSGWDWGNAVTIADTFPAEPFYKTFSGNGSALVWGAASSTAYFSSITLNDSGPVVTVGSQTTKTLSLNGSSSGFLELSAGSSSPSISSISPSLGSTAGGTSVTLTGTGLSGVSAVTVGGVAASSFTVDSDTQITLTTPAGSAGAQTLQVSDSYGSDTETFTYGSAPSISGLSSSSGVDSGGTSVTLTGSSLTGASAVTVGGVAASSFTVDSDSQISLTTPAGSVGAQTLQVTTSFGSASTSFLYLGVPSISGLSPSSGVDSGGTSVTLTGVGFTGVSAVTVGGVAASSFTVDSDTQITLTTPAGSAGAQTLQVTNSYGSDTDTFTYTEPASSSRTVPGPVRPWPQATFARGQVVVTWEAPVDEGAAPVSSYEVVLTPGGASCSTLVLRCVFTVATDGPFSVSVTASNSFGAGAATTVEVRIADDLVAIDSVSPSSLSILGGDLVTVTGRNLDLVDSVVVGATRVDVESRSTDATTLSFITPPSDVLGRSAVTVTASSTVLVVDVDIVGPSPMSARQLQTASGATYANSSLVPDGQVVTGAVFDVLASEPGTGFALNSALDAAPTTVRTGEQVLQVADQQIELDLAGNEPDAAVVDPETATLIFSTGREGITTGRGFLPNTIAEVWLFSEPRFLGYATILSDGTFSETFLVPDDIELGDHTIQVEGTTVRREVRAVTAGVKVQTGATEDTSTDMSTLDTSAVRVSDDYVRIDIAAKSGEQIALRSAQLVGSSSTPPIQLSGSIAPQLTFMLTSEQWLAGHSFVVTVETELGVMTITMAGPDFTGVLSAPVDPPRLPITGRPNWPVNIAILVAASGLLLALITDDRRTRR